MATLFNDVRDKIFNNHEKLKEGKVNCIPFVGLPKLSKHIPGIIKGTPYLISAGSGIGKTQLTKFLFVYEPYKYIKKHPECNITLEIHYFPLEESKEEFMLGLIAKYLSDEHGLDFSTQELEGYYSNVIFDDTVKTLINEAESYFVDLFNYLHIVDDVKNPTGIMKHMRNVAAKVGDFYYKGQKLTTPETNDWNNFRYDHYVEHNENHYVICIVDHLSLLDEEKNNITGVMMTKHQTIGKWSADYSRYLLTKKFNQIVVNVQQQTADSDAQQFTVKGESIKEKVIPSHDKLADNKQTFRDAKVVLYAFSPAKYGFKTWAGYDITVLEDKFRAIIIGKNRYGKPDLNDYVFFDGKITFFRELPDLLKEKNKMDLIYNKIRNKEL